MAFQTPITIKEAIDNLRVNKYLLPVIQREVVWDTYQIERLFDSLMRNYPIGSFLFWFVEKKKVGNYQFYEFLRSYHERDKCHNPKASVSGQDDIIGILDGQQRLTSLYLGLLGSYAYKEPRKRWDNPQAFPSRQLYLNLLSPSKDGQRDLQYDFSFLTASEAAKSDEDTYWFKVGDILNLKDQAEVNDYLVENGLLNRDRSKAKFANRTLFQLWAVVHKEQVINYFLEKDESLDKVLNIFIRVNSGGTILSYSDLLLSVAAAQWKKRDAREEITAFVDEINRTGDGFNFNKDTVLKSCLVLAEISDIAFRVDNFNKPNMLRIEAEWEQICTALRHTVTLVSAYGYNRDTLTANNAIIPIAYYLLKAGLSARFDQASRFSEDRNRIKRWLTLSLLKRVFGGQPDTVLRPVREVIRNSASQSFPLEAIIEEFKGTNKSLVFSDDDVENLLLYKYGEGYTFSTLALLYPTLDFRNKFHVDHIFPRSFFTRTRLVRKGVAPEDVDSFISQVDLLPNLQLLEGIPNQEKSDSDFKEWFERNFVSKQQKADYIAKHFIPDVDLSLTNFRKFIEERREILKKRFAAVLNP
jgi:uncharacterized protein with ParB-like and HNH nuclease domain